MVQQQQLFQRRRFVSLSLEQFSGFVTITICHEDEHMP